MRREPPEEALVGAHSKQRRVAQRGLERRERGLPIGGVDDHLREQRVVVGRDDAALLDRRVDARALGPTHVRDATGGGKESRGGILGIEPHLERMPARLCIDREALAHGDP